MLPTVADFWLFDGEHVAFTVFEPGGRFAGGPATTDPTIVARCCKVRDLVWQTAIPHRDYIHTDHVRA
ncbi:MAG: hypothetical protein M3Y48_16080 [Actinomycetota bacterium]|nr:hypothetical protein [Actinomycetota bacterium]